MIHLLLFVIYLAFISLGLPDSLLGSAWPIIHIDMEVDVAYAGIISTIISAGTIFSSLQSDRLTKRFSTNKVTVSSVFLTTIALIGFSRSQSFWQLCFWAIPYGLGAGSVDASLNNYVALHFKSHHMSWLHCMWGVGAATGPYVMGYALTYQQSWQQGYFYIAMIQVLLTIILLSTLPLWNRVSLANHDLALNNSKTLTIKEILTIPGVKSIMLSFFCYSAIEQATGLWTSSYLVEYRSFTPEVAASYAALFFIGITIGRAISGFLTFKFSDEQMIRIGSGILCLGILLMILPYSNHRVALISLVLIGLGCAPIYPSIIHMSPRYFGRERSQAIIGVQMASAYIGSLSIPPLLGVIFRTIGMKYLPYFLGVLLVLMIVMSELFMKKSINKGVKQ